MKILFIAFFVPYPPTAGHLQRNFNLIREIACENEIYLLAFNQKVLLPNKEAVDKSLNVLNDYCRYIKVFDIPSDVSAIKWYWLLFWNLFSTKPFTIWRYHSDEMVKEIKRIQKEEKFDLLHIDTVDLAEYAGLVNDIPKVLNHHNVESILLQRRAEATGNPLAKFYLWLQAKKLQRYESKALKEFDTNVCVSKYDQIEFEKFTDVDNYEIVSNGTDIDYFTPHQEAPEMRLVYAGGMSYYPNGDAMIYFCKDILPLIRAKCPEVKFDVIGSHPPKQLQTIAEADSSVVLHGFVDDTRGIIAKASVYVTPIRIGGGTRLKILDAFANGKAVVSTSIGCEGLDVTDGENILMGDTDQEFADLVLSLLNDSELRRKLEANGRKLVEEKYSWVSIGAGLNTIYKNLISK